MLSAPVHHRLGGAVLQGEGDCLLRHVHQQGAEGDHQAGEAPFGLFPLQNFELAEARF